MLKNKNEQAKTVSQKIFNFFTSGNYDLVITNCKKNIKKFPEYLVFYNLLGSAYMNIGKFGLARETFTKALKMDPTGITIMNNLANSEKNLFNYRSAEILFLKIIRQKVEIAV